VAAGALDVRAGSLARRVVDGQAQGVAGWAASRRDPQQGQPDDRQLEISP
jgi:hypothetical protein